ncbi:MAG: hypothetical protein E6704_06965 [Anaerococcus prevotii]|nr:hypothetical protein [Anaerococcus prevotii]
MNKKVFEVFNIRFDRSKLLRIVIIGGVVTVTVIALIVKSNADKKAKFEKEFAEEEKPEVEYVVKNNEGERKDLSNYSSRNKISNNDKEIDLSEYELKKDNLIDEKLNSTKKANNQSPGNEQKRIEPKNGDMHSATANNTSKDIEEYNNSVFKKEYIEKNNKLKSENIGLKKDNEKLNVEIDKLKKEVNDKNKEIEDVANDKKEIEKKLNESKTNEEVKETFVLTKELSKKSVTNISFDNYEEIKEFIRNIEADSYVVLISDEDNLISIRKDKDEIQYKLYKKANKDMSFDDFFNAVIANLRDNGGIDGIDVEELNEESFLTHIKKSNQLVIERELVYGN